MAEIKSFAETNPYTLSSEIAPDGWTKLYLATTKPITNLYAPSVNAVLQAQRVSLDYLAVALAEANGAVDPTDTYFPVAKSKACLAEKSALKKIRRLAPADQAIILDTQPYLGGNDNLFALHKMNVERKHRRLGLLAGATQPVGFGAGAGGCMIEAIALYAPTILSRDPHLIAMAQFEGNIEIQVATEITFCDVPGREANAPVIETLREFSHSCRQVVARFS
jgi:hypothetical protein